MKGIIKIGSAIMHDFSFGKWPSCKPPLKEYENKAYRYEAKNPHMLFDIVWKNDSWLCLAPGYGELGNYGNGGIIVRGRDSVLPVIPVTVVTTCGEVNHEAIYNPDNGLCYFLTKSGEYLNYEPCMVLSYTEN